MSAWGREVGGCAGRGGVCHWVGEVVLAGPGRACCALMACLGRDADVVLQGGENEHAAAPYSAPQTLEGRAGCPMPVTSHASCRSSGCYTNLELIGSSISCSPSAGGQTTQKQPIESGVSQGCRSAKTTTSSIRQSIGSFKLMRVNQTQCFMGIPFPLLLYAIPHSVCPPITIA